MKSQLAFIAILLILGFAGFCQEAVDLGLSVKWATCNVGANKPEEYRVGDILRLTEGTLSPVACLEHGAPDCPRKDACRTLPLWTKLDDLVENYLDSVTIADLMK